MLYCKDCAFYDKADHDEATRSRCFHSVTYDMVTGETVAPTCAECRDTHLIHQPYQCGPNARFFQEKV